MHSKNQKRHSSPVPSRSPLVPMKPKAPAVTSAVTPNPGDTLAFRVPKDYPHSRFSKAPLAVYPPKGARTKTCVTLPVVSLEKMPCLGRPEPAPHVRLPPPASSSPLKSLSATPPGSQHPGEKLTNGRGGSGPSTPRSITPPSSLDRRASPAHSPLDRRSSSTPSPSPLDRRSALPPSPSHRALAMPAALSIVEKKQQQNGTKAPSRSHKRLSGRVFDPNKHCGVQDPETKRPCTRSLTCKTHSLTHRRAVLGRKKHFDVLLAEHKEQAKEREALKEREKCRDAALGGKETGSQSVPSQEAPCPSKSQCPNGRPFSTLKLRLANAHVPRVLGSSFTSTSCPPPPTATPTQPPNPDPAPHSWATAGAEAGRLSSDEGEVETPDDTDRPGLVYSSHHPQPSGFCMFNSRLMGRGYYVFDRRWDKMRLALQSMVEKHVNAQMWKKVPLAAESLSFPSQSSASSAVCPPAHLLPSFTSPSNSVSHPAGFHPPGGTFSVRDPSQRPGAVFPLPKGRNSTHKSSRPPLLQDSVLVLKKKKNSSHSSSSTLSFASSSTFQTVDKKNSSSFYSSLQSSGGKAAAAVAAASASSSPAKKRRPCPAESGQSSGADVRLNRGDAPLSLNSQNSREISAAGMSFSNRESASASHQSMPPPTGPLAYGGGAEGRKRRSPSSYKGKPGKLSRPGGFESLFGKGSDSGGILASGPESQSHAKLHH